MCDADVDGGAGGDIARLAGLLFLVRAEQAGVVTLLDHDERDARLVVGFQLDACLSNGYKYMRSILKICPKYTYRLIHAA